jgi:pimeloyl-ACP methyl ester carboxylesterase
VDTYSRGTLTFDVTDAGPRDGRVVIALHGFPEDRHCWDQLIGSVVDEGYRVLAPDQRGYSPRARPAGRRQYVIGELSADVLALADAAGTARFDVVGHDWGGLVAWDLAARHPDRIRTVTSLSTPHPRAMLDSMVRSTQALHSWYMLFFQVPRLPEKVMGLRGGKQGEVALERAGLDPTTAARYARRLSTPGAMTGPVNWYRALPLAARNRLPKVDVPALYIWSDGDRFLTRTAARLTAKYVTGPYRFEVLHGRNHWLPTEAAEQVGPLLLDHLRAHQVP